MEMSVISESKVVYCIVIGIKSLRCTASRSETSFVFCNYDVKKLLANCPQHLGQMRLGYLETLLYGRVSEGLGTTEFSNFIG